MGGLAAKMPITAALALIGFMNITGVPPSLGLWSEVLIVFGAVSRASQIGAVAFALLVVGLLVAIGLSTAYSFITMKRIFFGPISPEIHSDHVEAKMGILFPILIIAAVGVLLFFFPGIFIDPLVKFISSIPR
jgi:NADH-quinone oxidoreductase subunit M